MSLLQVISVSKSFSGTPILHEVSFHADQGEILCLLGPSGCGKTTLLRIIAGLETADTGHVLLAGQPLDQIPVHQRGFGLMFQDYALFPHMNVADNVAFGLRMQGRPGDQIQGRVAEMLSMIGLVGYDDRRVYDLSGGEQQRVALARSLAPGPRLLMLDEPLGSLDRALREELMNELRAILKRVSVTAIYVTHDQQEAFAIADRVVIMRQGRVIQTGTPQAVYRYPASPWVAHFLGLASLIPGRVIALDPLQVDTPLGRLRLVKDEPVAAGQEVTVLLRPEAARLASGIPASTDMLIEGTVHERSFRGSHYRLVVHHESGQDLAFELASDAPRLPDLGEPVALVLRPEAISLLIERNHEQGTNP
jgi:ABC-type Fe3+/spermidine/putrescine transport system ATPase subunit